MPLSLPACQVSSFTLCYWLCVKHKKHLCYKENILVKFALPLFQMSGLDGKCDQKLQKEPTNQRKSSFAFLLFLTTLSVSSSLDFNLLTAKCWAGKLRRLTKFLGA